jgi:hypothetical protein
METDFKQLGPLDEIAGITRALTYGEMIDLAAELWKAAGGAEIKLRPKLFRQSFTNGQTNAYIDPRRPHPLTTR